MRPSQISVVGSGVFAAIPTVSGAAGATSAGLRPSQVGPAREGDGVPELQIQRCGIGSSCDCPARDQRAGIEHDLQRAIAAGGTPLPTASRQRMERAFSSDFAAVRVHTGAAAHDTALSLGARALTAGTNILFRTGEYQPGTPGGDRLLAHELAHVIQQAHGLPQGILDNGATDPLENAAGLAADHASPDAEREAHGSAMIAAMGALVPALSRQPPTIARQDDLDAGSLPGGTTTIPDAGTTTPDAGTTTPDAGTGLTDAGAAWTPCVMPGPRNGLNILAKLDNICGRMKAAGFCTRIGSALRTIDEQIQTYAKGRSFADFKATLDNELNQQFITQAKHDQWVSFFDPAQGNHPMPPGEPGPVTWTLHSHHLTGNAADVVECTAGWGAPAAFWPALNTAAQAEGLQIGPPASDVAHVQTP